MEVRDVFVPSSVQMPTPKATEIPGAQFSQIMSRQTASQNKTAERSDPAPTKASESDAKLPAKQSEATTQKTVVNAGSQTQESAAVRSANSEASESTASEDMIAEAVSNAVEDLEKSLAEIELIVASIIAKPEGHSPELVVERESLKIDNLIQPQIHSQSTKALYAYGMTAEPVEEESLYTDMIEVFDAGAEEQLPKPFVELEASVKDIGEQVEKFVEAEVMSEITVSREMPKQEKQEATSVMSSVETEAEQPMEKLTKVTEGADSSEVKDDNGKKPTQEFTVSAGAQKTEIIKHYEVMDAKADAPIVRQVVEAITADVRILPTGNAVEVQLTPEHLGKVVMKLELQEGAMTANIKVENPEVKAALETSIQELKNALSEKGITVKEVNVEVNKDGHRGGEQYNGDGRKRRGDNEEAKRFELKPDKEEK